MTITDIPDRIRRSAAGTALALAATVAACSGDEPGALPRPDEPTSVRVSEVVTTPVGSAYPATVTASREARIATRASGRIARIPVDVGSRVGAGDTLVVLDDSDVRARIEGAEAGARLARRTFRRVRALADDGAASEHELDQARMRLEAAEAELTAARTQAEYTNLIAPFAGVVTGRAADPGDLAAPGRPVLTLVGDGARVVRADLPARLASRVEEGDSAWVVGPGGGGIAVRIARVSPALSPSARRFRIEAELPSGAGLPPGAFVRISLDALGETTRWIPADALVRRGQLAGVYTVADGHLELRWVRPGLERGDAVELLAGPDGPVVRSPEPGTYDGRPVSGVERVDWAGPHARQEVTER